MFDLFSGAEKATWATLCLIAWTLAEIGLLYVVLDAYTEAPTATMQALVAGIVLLPSVVVGGWLGGQVADGLREALTEEDDR